jgi:pimeloyl-ACP methyl ester carboxylesterase
MAKPTPRPTAKPVAQQKQPQEIVDPRWLFKMLGLAFAAALVCGYITVAFVFYFTSWQLVLHPTRNTGGGTALPSERIRFGADAAGTPQLAGEWLPAEPTAPRGKYAILYLRAADGQLDPADGTQIATLHTLGLNVLAFDYRGYGSSAPQHPTEANMLADAHSAFNYLTSVRNIQPNHIIVFGSGVGVSVAAQLLQSEPGSAGLIGYNADPEVLARVKADRRSAMFPIALFHDRFPLDALNTLKKPKLLYTVGPLNPARTAAYKSAADPKLTVEVPTHASAEERAALARFFDENFPVQPSTLRPPS